ncbi:hypothetical protein [Amycolatopsis taiwanensis]|uniref:DUF4386 family protein n=1 Tax=Amycolatopsis taiwanensis TaxID=342230 RepID=A0A9W6VFW4_9PSEU|nr:hypothetical protein [Amycolatopsis taiwanensis]GLY67190.1 hypothetical protein Atai01_38090 [Amycolatopsis taiwanensis]
MALLTSPGTDIRGARAAAIGLGLAGVLFAVYPATRPYSDESTLDGAAAMASPAWIVAHLAAVVGFVLVSLGLLALRLAIGGTGLARASVISGLVGVGLTLPYYGAEVFGGNAIAARALADNNPALMSAVDAMRFNPAAAVLFAGGLLLIAVAAILVAAAIWRSGALPRSSGVLFAVAFALFIPQFYASPALRIAHGVLVAVGCLWLATGLWQVRRTAS